MDILTYIFYLYVNLIRQHAAAQTRGPGIKLKKSMCKAISDEVKIGVKKLVKLC